MCRAKMNFRLIPILILRAAGSRYKNCPCPLCLRAPSFKHQNQTVLPQQVRGKSLASCICMSLHLPGELAARMSYHMLYVCVEQVTQNALFLVWVPQTSRRTAQCWEAGIFVWFWVVRFQPGDFLWWAWFSMGVHPQSQIMNVNLSIVWNTHEAFVSVCKYRKVKRTTQCYKGK